MLDTVDRLSGERLQLSPYQDDFDARLSSLRDADVWKLERQQDFHQPESESWMAFREGRRSDSLRILEKSRPSLQKAFAELARSGCTLRRVRVVERPFTTYLLWELHSLHLRAQCGEDVRIVSADPLARFESSHQVPELVNLGDEVTYKILYDHRGVLRGGERFTDPAVTTRCRAEIAALHAEAEPLQGYFAREVGGTEAHRA
ncbi:hypothetical protein IDM40_03095 [Nocardiopsis sp. HNM0947]|uniref:DUF6879 domain-containing protein n=1 Tax=Nocardiopsis coralli TaxID=2772213 RepID=A0ABR9P1I0_9ACTN|nr:DUF6879 family protein [Nocardiopsis coralli]MBE2997697.1 hypothetical protein [Nocardiopsis coralli]